PPVGEGIADGSDESAQLGPSGAAPGRYAGRPAPGTRPLPHGRSPHREPRRGADPPVPARVPPRGPVRTAPVAAAPGPAPLRHPVLRRDPRTRPPSGRSLPRPAGLPRRLRGRVEVDRRLRRL